MRTHKRHPNTLRGAVTAVLASIVLVATAQAKSVQPPAGLMWQPMHSFTINSNPVYISNATKEEGELLKQVWVKELNHESSPDFVISNAIQIKGVRYVFSIMTRDVNLNICEPAPNGSAAVDHMYWNCPLRASAFLSDGSYKFRDFPGYCIMFGMTNDPGTPSWSQNHNEFAYDSQQGMVYFRVIQFGKIVPECNRSIRLRKV